MPGPLLTLVGMALVAAPPLESLQTKVGPFTIGGRKYEVRLDAKRIAGVSDPDFGQTVTGLEIRDETGTVHYRASFPYEVDGNRFTETLGVGAESLRARGGAGLLITYSVLPSAPLGGQSWQIFGTIQGKLIPFSKPVSADGELAGPPQWDPEMKADLVSVRVWTGNFFAVVPLRIDWMMGRVGPAHRCYRMTAGGLKPACRFRVETDRRASGELTFIRLFPEPEEQSLPEHVVVKSNSRLSFLEAEAELHWEETADHVGLGISGDVWLKVRVDGKEGWIHTQEDFQAIGLPQAG